MPHLATLKKRGVIADAPAAPEWELAETCSSWEDADRYRTAIINNSQRAARVRYEQPNYIVEWKS